MSDLIAQTRRRYGLTQADLAARAGVTPAAVSQWERSERAGRARLETVDRALRALGRSLAVVDAPRVPLRRADGDESPFGTLPAAGQGREIAYFRARHRIRTAALAYDLLADGSAFSLADLWVLAEGTTVATDDMWGLARVEQAMAWHRQAMRDAKAPCWEPAVRDRHGRLVEPRGGGHPVGRWLRWAADMIANGIDHLEARYKANTGILRDGFDWIMLGPDDLEFYRHAVGRLVMAADPAPFYELMAARYDERF